MEIRVDDVLKKNEKGISLEFFPPKSEKGFDNLEKTVEQLMPLKPLFYSITETGPSETLDMSQKELALLALEVVRGLTDIPGMLHYTCSGLTQESVEIFIKIAKIKKIANILALRGPKFAGDDPHKLAHANELMLLLRDAGMCVAGAVYPETHPDSLTITNDRKDTLTKVNAGMSLSITQLFFENTFYYDFLEWLSSQDINIPIIPGILADFRNLVKFCHGCGTGITLEVMREIAKREGDTEALDDYAIEFATRQIKDLWDNGVRFFHIYTINKSEAVIKICQNLPFLTE